MKGTPPIWPLRFLRWFCRKDHLEEIEGDLFELFDIKTTDRGFLYARRTFLFDTLKFFRWSNFKKPKIMKYSINKGLWIHNFKISLRVLKRNVLFSGINVIGLVMGITAFAILLLYYLQETSYDKFFEDHENTYRVAINSMDDGHYQESAKAPVPLIDLYEGSLESEATFCRMLPWPGYLRYGEEDKAKENQFLFADATVLDIFPLEVIQGSSTGDFAAPFQLIITQSKALAYFGNRNPIGETLTYDEGSGEFEFNVVAVIKDLPYNTHLNIDFIASIKSLDQIAGWYNNWFYPSTYLYAHFDNPIEVENIEKKAQLLLKENANPGYVRNDPEVVLQPLTSIHLTSNRQGEWKANNTQINVGFFLALGVFILLIAVINYINLTTANSQQRTREIGVKKAMGSVKSQLIKQFLVEGFMMTSFSMLISVLLFFILWNPVISQILDKSTILSFLLNYQTILLSLAGLLLLATLTGAYPAFTTLRFNPVDVIRNNMGKYMNKSVQRKALVTIQFSISMVLILFTLLLVRQYFFLQSKDAGFAKDYRVALRMLDDYDAKNYMTLKEQLKQLSFVEEASISSTLVGLGEGFYGLNITFPDRTEMSGVEWFSLGVDEDYLKTYDIKLMDGRDFNSSILSDQREAFIMNQTAANQIGGSVIGENMELTVYTGTRDVRKGKVIGVVADFHYQSLYEEIKPLIIYINTHEHYTDYLNVRLNSQKSIAEQVEAIEEVYSEFNPDKSMELLFIGDEIKQTYKRELASSKIMLWFTILSIFIATLGAFGLAMYSFRRRTKEIGVRKVLGASQQHITFVLLREYLLILIISSLVSWPIVYYLSSQWLNNFAYSIRFGWINYLFGLLLLVSIIIMTNLYQIILSIRLKPVEHLRTE